MDERPGHAGPALAEFLDHGGGGIDVLPLPAIVFGNGQADQAHGGEFAEEVPVPGVGAVPFPAFLARHLLRHPARQLAAQFRDMIGLGRERLIHHPQIIPGTPIGNGIRRAGVQSVVIEGEPLSRRLSQPPEKADPHRGRFHPPDEMAKPVAPEFVTRVRNSLVGRCNFVGRPYPARRESACDMIRIGRRGTIACIRILKLKGHQKERHRPPPGMLSYKLRKPDKIAVRVLHHELAHANRIGVAHIGLFLKIAEKRDALLPAGLVQGRGV